MASGLLGKGAIGNYHDAMTGETGKDAAQEAMLAQMASIADAEKYLQETGGEISGRYAPMSSALPAAWQYMLNSATPEGLAKNLEDIQGSGMYDQIMTPRMDTLNKGLSSSGLSRSSYGGRNYANLSTDALMGLEQMLAGRQGNIAGIAYDATGQQAGMDTGLMNALAELKLRKGGVMAGGILGKADALAKGAQNKYTAIHNVGSGMFSMFGGGGGELDTKSTVQEKPTTSISNWDNIDWGYNGNQNQNYGGVTQNPSIWSGF